jgi:hypothetical protein
VYSFYMDVYVVSVPGTMWTGSNHDTQQGANSEDRSLVI